MSSFLCSSYPAFHNRTLLHYIANGPLPGYDQVLPYPTVSLYLRMLASSNGLSSPFPPPPPSPLPLPDPADLSLVVQMRVAAAAFMLGALEIAAHLCQRALGSLLAQVRTQKSGA